MTGDNQTQGSSCCGGCPCFDTQRVINIITKPKETWPAIKSEQKSITSIYKCYVLALAAIPVVAQFIRMTFIGFSIPIVGTIKWPFFSGLVHSAVHYAMILGGLYVMAVILEKLAPKFGGNASREDCFKLVAYASTPGFVAGVFHLIPMLGFLILVASIYGIYVFLKGVSVMTGVGEDKKMVYSVVAVICGIVVSVVAGILIKIISPDMPLGPPAGADIQLSEQAKQYQAQAQKMADQLEQLQKNLPQPPSQ